MLANTFFNCFGFNSLRKNKILKGTGVFPAADPWGKEFTREYHRKRFEVAGQKICGQFRVVLDGIQGDQDYIRVLLKPSRFLKNMMRCVLCLIWPIATSLQGQKTLVLFVWLNCFTRFYCSSKVSSLDKSAATIAGLYNGFM